MAGGNHKSEVEMKPLSPHNVLSCRSVWSLLELTASGGLWL